MATISRARVSGYTVFEMIRRKPLIARNKQDGVKRVAKIVLPLNGGINPGHWACPFH